MEKLGIKEIKKVLLLGCKLVKNILDIFNGNKKGKMIALIIKIIIIAIGNIRAICKINWKQFINELKDIDSIELSLIIVYISNNLKLSNDKTKEIVNIFGKLFDNSFDLYKLIKR